MTTTTPPGNTPSPVRKLRGVNLGGWLVLEKWITPSLFQGLAAVDETTYCLELGEAEATRRLHRHWNTFITRDDLAWLKRVGINAVRLPIGHWLFGKDYPYHASYGETRYPYVAGGIEIVDNVFEWSKEFGLLVLLDLHAAPGCQNGFDNGGIQGVCEWHTNEEYIQYSLDFLERLAQRYAGHPALHGFQVLNEPRWDIPTDLLKRYTTDAYHRIRRHCPAEQVTVVFNDGFRDWRQYAGFLQEPEFRNVALDIHRYQCFEKSDVDMDIFGHIKKSVEEVRLEADTLIRESGYQIYCGEWSLGMDVNIVTRWAEGPLNHGHKEMDEFQLSAAFRGFASAQLLAFEKYAGWFFWTYRTETRPEWCYRDCVEQAFFPDLGRPEQFARIRVVLDWAKAPKP